MEYDTLEDFLGDIVGKARRGLGISEAELGKETGLTTTQLSRIESYELVPDDSVITSLARVLSLDSQKLIGIARGWVPKRGNESHSTSKILVERVVLDAGMIVNAYVMKCVKTGAGAIIDAGGQAERILGLVKSMSVDPTHILLTHGHGDHTGALQEVKEATGAQVCCSESDSGMLGSHKGLVDSLVDDGWTTNVGQLRITAASLPGHTAGGVGYGTDGVFFSGDALFAGSLGGARGAAYTGQIEAVRKRVLVMDGETRLFPGHGPITSVLQESEHNPCFV
jgi:hydroxyacylglutathione hydrolase